VKWSGWSASIRRPPRPERGALASLIAHVLFGKPVSTFPGHAQLSYILMALRSGIEPPSPDRQSGRLARCVTEHCFGARGRTRTGTVARRPLKTVRLPFRHARKSWRTRWDSNPRSCARRLKRPIPLPLGSLVQLVNRGGVEPLAHGLKVRCPADPGLKAPDPGAPFMGAHAVLVVGVCSVLVAPRGFDPRFLGYRPSALATRRRGSDGASCRSRPCGLRHVTAALFQLS
jgi:hypothetical protein